MSPETRAAGDIGDPPDVPPDNIDPIYHPLEAGTFLRRIYAPRFYPKPRPHHVGPDTFRHFGPTDRFDHHLPVSPPEADAQHGIYYAGVDLWDCAAEVFGRTKIIELGDNRFAELVIKEDLVLVDLRDNGSMRIGAKALLSNGGTRTQTQKWARYVHRHPDHFAHKGETAHGLIYNNFHNAGLSVALFERAASSLERHVDTALESPALRLSLELHAFKVPGYVIQP